MSWEDAIDEFTAINQCLDKIEGLAVDGLTQALAEVVMPTITAQIGRLMRLNSRASEDLVLAPEALARKRWADILSFDDLVVTTVKNAKGRELSATRSSVEAGYKVICMNGVEYKTEDL